MTPCFYTDEYAGSHGRTPKGVGLWWFSFGRDGAYTDEAAPGPMSYGDAKKWALRNARTLGADTIIVLP